jgi:peptide chain release factor 2
MIEFDSYRLELEAMEEPLAQLKKALHIEHLGDEISELEARAQEPGFWEDTDKAQKVQTRLKNLQKKLDRFHKMERQRDDLLVLCELGDEAEDTSLIPELSEGMGHLKEEMDNLRLETLFTGSMTNNAILTLHAGQAVPKPGLERNAVPDVYPLGGTARFEIKILDILEGEEAGLKSVSFQLIGENAFGYTRSEMGVHRLVRISPFDSSGRRHTSFASLEVMPELDDSIKIEIRPEDLRIDTYRASVRADNTSIKPIPQSGSPTFRPAS